MENHITVSFNNSSVNILQIRSLKLFTDRKAAMYPSYKEDFLES
jgi:hypothetical protein